MKGLKERHNNVDSNEAEQNKNLIKGYTTTLAFTLIFTKPVIL